MIWVSKNNGAYNHMVEGGGKHHAAESRRHNEHTGSQNVQGVHPIGYESGKRGLQKDDQDACDRPQHANVLGSWQNLSGPQGNRKCKLSVNNPD